MSSFLFTGGRLLDPRRDSLCEGMDLLVEDGRVKEVSDRPIRSDAATRIDLRGRTAMPGLIDAHIHLLLTEVNLQILTDVPLTLLAAKGSVAGRAMLMRGFTTLRDTGGTDWGLKTAFEQGLFEGPRLFISGAPISQTGGHGDFRKRTQTRFECACCAGVSFVSRIADGLPEVIQATRDELRKGADQIKIMASGGVASQLDPLESLQFRIDEIEAVVDEATRWGTYVCAHAYSAEAITRAVAAGVRTIEHGNLVDEAAAKLMAERGAFMVPTLVTYQSMHQRGIDFGMSKYSLAKNEMVLHAGLRSIDICRAAGVQIGFGTDLLGPLQGDQCNEFRIRAQSMPAADVIRSATIVNAQILRQEGQLGELVPGAHADLLVVEGDPYRDINVLAEGGSRLAAIMLGGRFVKNELR